MSHQAPVLAAVFTEQAPAVGHADHQIAGAVNDKKVFLAAGERLHRLFCRPPYA